MIDVYSNDRRGLGRDFSTKSTEYQNITIRRVVIDKATAESKIGMSLQYLYILAWCTNNKKLMTIFDRFSSETEKQTRRSSFKKAWQLSFRIARTRARKTFSDIIFI